MSSELLFFLSIIFLSVGVRFLVTLFRETPDIQYLNPSVRSALRLGHRYKIACSMGLVGLWFWGAVQFLVEMIP